MTQFPYNFFHDGSVSKLEPTSTRAPLVANLGNLVWRWFERSGGRFGQLGVWVNLSAPWWSIWATLIRDRRDTPGCYYWPIICFWKMNRFQWNLPFTSARFLTETSCGQNWRSKGPSKWDLLLLLKFEFSDLNNSWHTSLACNKPKKLLFFTKVKHHFPPTPYLGFCQSKP